MVDRDERHGELRRGGPSVRLSDLVAPLPESRPDPYHHEPHADAGALIEHLLLNAMSSIVGAAATLRENWAGMPEERRAELLERMEANAMRVGVALRHVGTGDTVEALHLLRPTIRRNIAPARETEVEVEGVAVGDGDPT